MKSILYLAFALATATSVAAQSTTSIGPEVGFGGSHYLAEEGSIQAILAAGDDPGCAWRMGARLQHELSARTYVTSGLRLAYLSSRRAVDASDLRWGSQWNGTEFDPSLPGEDVGDGLLFISQIYLVEFPLELRYYLRADASGWYVQGGLVPTVTIGTRTVDRRGARGARGARLQTETLRRFWLGATAAVGYEWTCSERVAFYAQTGGTVQLLEEAPNSRSRHWDAGLMGGVRFGLR